MNDSSNNYLLNIQNLNTHFFVADGIAKAVDGLDLVVSTSETLGIVGESGCGKSMTALSILRLVPDPPGRIVAGRTSKIKGLQHYGCNPLIICSSIAALRITSHSHNHSKYFIFQPAQRA